MSFDVISSVFLLKKSLKNTSPFSGTLYIIVHSVHCPVFLSGLYIVHIPRSCISLASATMFLSLCSLLVLCVWQGVEGARLGLGESCFEEGWALACSEVCLPCLLYLVLTILGMTCLMVNMMSPQLLVTAKLPARGPVAVNTGHGIRK